MSTKKLASNKTLEELFGLLKHREPAKIDETRLEDSSERAEDYETGASTRANAALELGKVGDPRAIAELEEALYDHGDSAGCSEGRAVFYFNGAEFVQNAVVKALAMIGGEEAINALEKKLKDIDRCKRIPLRTYYGVSKKAILEALGDMPHSRTEEILKKIFNEVYPSDEYKGYYYRHDPRSHLDLGLTAAHSLRKLGLYLNRVILENGSIYGRGHREGKEYGVGWHGTVVNIGDKPVSNIRISTTISSSGKAIPFSKLVDTLKPDERTEFKFDYTENKWVEIGSMWCGVLKIEYKQE